MDDTISAAVAKFSTLDLQTARRSMEAELMAAMQAGVKGTQAHAGQIELLTAIGAELDRRGALWPSPPFVDVCVEDGIRYPMQVRVF